VGASLLAKNDDAQPLKHRIACFASRLAPTMFCGYFDDEGSTCHVPRRRMRAFPGQSRRSIGHHGRV